MKKRIIPICLALLMVIMLLPSTVVATTGVSITVGNGTVEPGGTVTVDVNITGASSASLMAMYLTFDFAEDLTLTNAVLSAEAQTAGFAFGTNNLADGIIQIDGNVSNGSSMADGVLLQLTFKAAETASDNYTIGVGYAEEDPANVYDINYNDVACTFNAGTVTVEKTSEPESPTIPTDKAYTADLDTNYENVKVGDTITVDVLVGGTTGEFASSELELSYTGLTFDSDNSTANGADITAENGAIKIIDHGETTTWTEGTVTAYTLTFTVDAIQDTEGSANVTLTGAKFSTAANAATQDLSAATVTINEQAFTVYPADLTVTLPDGFISVSGSNTVEYGKDFTFRADNIHYTYDLDATPYQVVDNQDGTWTVKNVTSNMVITENVVNRVPKTYTITFNTLDHIQNAESLNAQEKDGAFVIDVTYNTDFSFILKDNVAVQPGEAGVTYAVESITYATGGDVTVTGPTTEKNRTYTIDGENITGHINITTSATPVNPDQFTVTLPAGYSNELSANPTVVDEDDPTTVLTLTPEAGYKYTVSYKMGENDAVEIKATDWVNNQYTISGITANVTVTVVKTVDQSVVNVEIKDEYLVWQEGEIGKEMHMVVITGANLAAGKIYTYDGQPMYYTTNYDNVPAYVYLVVTNADDSFTVETARAKVGIDTETAKEIVYNGDVNMVGTNNTVDANDAQFVWNMYNGMYNGFVENVTMEKYLRADMDGNGKVETNDAAEIIKLIPKN